MNTASRACTDQSPHSGQPLTGTQAGRSSQVDDRDVNSVWEHLKIDPAALLVDVRTRAEWTFVGLPDLSTLGKRVVTVEWQSLPEHSVDTDFTHRLKSILADLNAGTDTPMYFICRSGSRSRMAADAMTELGYHRCYNVADGFEGPLDTQRHRGNLGGWKAAGLAWIQG